MYYYTISSTKAFVSSSITLKKIEDHNIREILCYILYVNEHRYWGLFSFSPFNIICGHWGSYLASFLLLYSIFVVQFKYIKIIIDILIYKNYM